MRDGGSKAGKSRSPRDDKKMWDLLRLVALLAALAIGCLRFLHLTADFPNFSRWSLDQAKYTDEGWWANAAAMHHLLGHWYIPGDYNPAVAVPVWPALLGLLFHFTGVSPIAARSFSVVTSLATLGIVFVLVRRYTRPGSALAASMAILLLASSPFAFVFSRLAILDSFVIFQFCLLLLIASYSSSQPVAALAALCLLVPTILLTKTTALVLLPAVLWVAWTALKPRRSLTYRILALGLAGIVSAALVRGYVALVFRSGFGEDYRYFFDINQVEDIDWKQTLPTLIDLVKQGMLIDRIVFPLAVVAVVVACVWMRRLWRNPLFTASCLAFAGQASYIFIRQGNYAPRYFLPMLVPVVVMVALMVDELGGAATEYKYGDSGFARMTVVGVGSVVAAAFVLNMASILSLLRHPTYQFYTAGKFIEAIVRRDPGPNHLLLGVSGSEISLMTGLPSINDVYGTEPLAEKIARYQPGWYVAWTGIGPEERKALAGYRIERVGTWPAFDDDERNELILYRLTPGR